MGTTRTVDWTPERIAAHSTADVKQLRANAERLHDPNIVALCDAELAERSRKSGAEARARRAASGRRGQKSQETGGAA